MDDPVSIRAVPGRAAEIGDCKSAAIAAAGVSIGPGVAHVRGFAEARRVLRDNSLRQAGIGAEHVSLARPEHASVFFLDGPAHRRRRAAIAPFFTPRAIEERYRAIMERAVDGLLARLRADGRGRLDEIAFRLAAVVAVDVIGLTESPPDALMHRLRRGLECSIRARSGRGRVSRGLSRLRAVALVARVFAFDVLPAIRARRRTAREDVVSHLVREGHPARAILAECLTYATAGVVTTREFMVMAAWHLFGDESLRARFLAGGAAVQVAILEEILRLEPVVALLHRRGPEPGARLQAIDLRAANLDEAAVGACPMRLDPDRAAGKRPGGVSMSFGDGEHRCPGAQMALQETRIFLDRLLRLPGVRLERAPVVGWLESVNSYELRDAVVACDRHA